MIGLGWLFGSRQKQAPEYKPTGDSYRQPMNIGQQTTGKPRFTASVHRRAEGTRWICPDETFKIGGLSIKGGMVYVGPTGRHDRAWRSTIDPSIQVSRRNADFQGALMPYWPSYAEIDPRSRLAYLQWLASGRSDPMFGLGHVFLFFYGLERRLFADEAYSDLPMLVAEVERLRGIYGDNRSFRRYSGHFLEAAHALQLITTENPTQDQAPPLDLDNDWELPLTLRIGLGRRIAARQALTADWMLSWYLSHPETRLRTPAIRAFDKLCLLFRCRFDATYPDGMRFAPPKSKLRQEYRAASGDFTVTIAADLPDIAKLRKPIQETQAIVEKCTDELSPFSRYVGKRPEAAHSLQALVLLPSEIRNECDSGAGKELARWLQTVVGTAVGVAKASDLLSRLEVDPCKTDRVPKGIAQSMSTALAAFGYGMEPDPVYGSPSPKQQEAVALFKLPESRSDDHASGPAYAAARSVLLMSAVIAHADGVIADQEIRQLVGSVQGSPHLATCERRRLSALATWLLLVPPPFNEIKKRLGQVSETERRSLAQFALAMAAADDRIDPKEIEQLERLYKLLNLEPSVLYSDLHALECDASGPEEGPVTVRQASKGAPQHRIPPPPKTAPLEPITLDHSRIERVRRETEVVASVLSGIFATPTDDSDPDPIQEPSIDEPVAFEGLDRRHASLLDEILGREAWSRAEIEALCRGFELMPDGAMETLNEWSFERFDAAIIEYGDTLFVQYDVLPEDIRKMAA